MSLQPMDRFWVLCSVLASGSPPAGLNSKINHGLFSGAGLGTTQILQQPDAQPIAEFKANWLGGGMLIFADGRQFQLTTKGFCRPVWSWIDNQGRKLLDVTPHNKSVVLVGAVENSYLPVLIMLSWHQILQANDDAASAIAASVAVAG